MKNIFDYVFYKALDYYKSGEDKSPRAGAISVVSVIQFLFILDISMLLDEYGIVEVKLYKVYVTAIGVLLFIINMFRYSNKNLGNELEKKWGNEDEEKSKNRKFIIVLFVISSLGFIVYRGLK